MPTINTVVQDGSALIATLGLDWFVSSPNKVRPITDAQLKKAAKLADELRRDFREFLSTPYFSKPVPGQLDLGSFEQVSDALIAFNEDMLAVRLSAIADPEYKLMVGQTVTAAVNTLRERIPPTPVRSLDRRTPSTTFKSASFLRAWRTLSDPLSLVRDMEVGYLCRDQIDTLAAVFPGLYEFMSTALLEAIIDHESTTGEPIPYKKLKQIAVFLGQPLVSEDLKGLLAQNFSSQEQEPSLGQGMGGASAPTSSLTNLQKREFGVS